MNLFFQDIILQTKFRSKTSSVFKLNLNQIEFYLNEVFIKTLMRPLIEI